VTASGPDSAPDPTTEPEVPGGFLGSLEIGSSGRVVRFAASLAGSLALSLLIGNDPELAPAARRALFILIFAASLWITEAIPAFAVGILVMALGIALLGRPGGVFAETDTDWEQFVSVLGHPLIWLFFGGFVLAAGMARTGLDRRLARSVLAHVGDRPSAVLLGVMSLGFVLSMFMSNTAATAMLLAMLAPLLATLRPDDRFSTGLVLGIAIGANLGGMASLIGTPPNAIAVGALAAEGTHVSFLQWMLLGLPIAAALLVAAWVLLLRLYPPSTERLDLGALAEPAADDSSKRWQRLVVGATLVITIGLWMTSRRHGLPTAVVAFLPSVVFTATGVLRTQEIRGLSYDVLFLIAGGLALGQMVVDTGLSIWIVSHLPLEGAGPLVIALVMSYVTVVLSNLMSNTAAANILIPIGITMAASGASPQIALPIALAASAAMCLPVATPPNALAYATGRCEARDFVRIGLLVAAVVPLAAVLWVRVMIAIVLSVE